MGLGILDDHKLDHVPGTAFVLEDERRREEEQAIARNLNLKYDKTGKILLVPQPSDDPNDPLNWPLWRRDLILAILSLTSVIATTLSPLLAANTVSVSTEISISLTAAALLTGYHLLGVGLAGFLFVPSARIWGKRHVYLLGTVIVIVSSIWGGANGGKGHYGNFVAARVFQGVGLAPFEALVNASVGDLYCVHERGGRMAVSNLALFGGAFLTPVVVGRISRELGYEWTFYLVGIFAAVMLPFMIFCVPETAFRREQRFDIDTMGNLVRVEEPDRGEGNGVQGARSETSRAELVGEGVANGGSNSTTAATETEKTNGEVNSEDNSEPTTPTSPSIPPKRTWKQSLAPFNGRYTDEPYLRLLLRPFSLFAHPSILWACLIQGTLIGWTVMIGVVLAAVFLGPPLWFGEAETGYMYTGAFIGALLGFGVAGALSDSSARWLTRRNRGVYEPEFRMVLVVPQAVFGCAGLYGFGVAIGSAERTWVWPDFCFGLVVLGMVCGAVASALYVVDAHRDMSIEGFTCLLVFKNLFSFALTFKGFDWIIEADDYKKVFVAIGTVQVVICALTVPMYIFGKRNRSFFWRHNVFFKATDWVADRRMFWYSGNVRSEQDTEGVTS